MILILIALLAVLVAATYLSDAGSYTYFKGLFCPTLIAVSSLALIGYAFVAFNYFASDYKANIINREYQTNYTQAEVFYASDVIETVQQLNRKRIELSGNLIKGE